MGGRQLAGMTNGTDMLSFAYNEKGLRTEKTVNNVTRKYIWNGSQLMADIGPNDALYFHYNSGDDMVGYTYKTANGETQCVFVKNLQGDVEKVLDAETGTVLASYSYDAWGNVLTVAGDMAGVNPIRYRGHFFDQETGLYYGLSRYYDPVTGRWINSDSYLNSSSEVLGTNMFAFCSNNSVIKTDTTGHNSESIVAEWVSSMWALTLLDGPLPMGDIIYFGGICVLGFYTLYLWQCSAPCPPSVLSSTETETPDVDYPGDDPTKAPSDDYEWRGNPPQGGKEGGYANKNGKDSWHPDLDHEGDVGPHWDYNDGNGNQWRVFPDGRIEPK